MAENKEIKKIPVEENTYDFIEPLWLTREIHSDDVVQLVPRPIPRTRRQSLKLKCPYKINSKILLYIGGGITLLIAFIGMIVASNAIQRISSLEEAVFHHCPGSTPDLPATSCQQVLDCNPSASSGHYWIGTTENVALRLCDMQRTCGGVTGGWLRLISLNMTEFGSTCPTGLTLKEYSGKNLCRKPQGYNGAGCGSVIFDTIGEYNKVCGKIILAINMVVQIHLEEDITQLIKFIWMVLVLLMEAHVNTSGHLLLL